MAETSPVKHKHWNEFTAKTTELTSLSYSKFRGSLNW